MESPIKRVTNTMGVILALSQKSFLKAITSKIFIIFLLFGIGLIFISILFEFLTFTAQLKIIKDVGLASISVFTALIAIFLAGESIVGEIEKKTIYILFSKPINKVNFILGNFLGIIWTTGLAIATTGGIFLIMIYLKQRYVEPGLLLALGFTGLEAIIIISIGIMFSSFSSSTSTSILLCLFVYILGHFNPQFNLLRRLIPATLLKEFVRLICFILPNLEYFNIRGEVTKGDPVRLAYTGKVILYALCYSAIMLICSYFILRKKEL